MELHLNRLLVKKNRDKAFFLLLNTSLYFKQN